MFPIIRSEKVSATVIGVVEEARVGSQKERSIGEIYLPASLGRRIRTIFLVKSSGPAASTARNVAAVLKNEMPDMLIARAESFDGALSNTVRLERFQFLLFSIWGGAALVLLAVGVAGFVATSVASRTREIGIRASLGATPRQIVRMFVVTHLRVAAVGMLCGLIASWWTVKLINAFLYEVKAHDLTSWSAGICILLLVVTLAAWVPARRATAVDPIVVLRAE